MKRILIALFIIAICHPFAAIADVGGEGRADADSGRPKTCGNEVLDPGEMCDYTASSPNSPCSRPDVSMICNAACICDVSFCGDGVVCRWDSPCSEVEECDPAAKPNGCAAGQACDIHTCKCKLLQIDPLIPQRHEIKRRPIRIQR